MRKSQSTPRWIVLVSACVLYAAACSPDAEDSSPDAGPPPSGMLSGPNEACVGDTVTFTLRYPEGTGSSTTIRYDVWLTGDVPNAANNVAVTVNPGYGEFLRVQCRDEGELRVRARGPGSDYHSEPLLCVDCGDGP